MTDGVARPVVGGDALTEVAAVEQLEEQFVALFAVFSHQRGEVLHRRRFYLLKTIERIYLTNGVEDIVAAGHLLRAEVARSFGY